MIFKTWYFQTKIQMGVILATCRITKSKYNIVKQYKKLQKLKEIYDSNKNDFEYFPDSIKNDLNKAINNSENDIRILATIDKSH